MWNSIVFQIRYTRLKSPKAIFGSLVSCFIASAFSIVFPWPIPPLLDKTNFPTFLYKEIYFSLIQTPKLKLWCHFNYLTKLTKKMYPPPKKIILCTLDRFAAITIQNLQSFQKQAFIQCSVYLSVVAPLFSESYSGDQTEGVAAIRNMCFSWQRKKQTSQPESALPLKASAQN